METDLNLSLWIGGTAFSLGVLVAKVALGLAVGGLKRRSTLLTYGLYFSLFIAAAWLSRSLAGSLLSILKAGPYLHAMVAGVMIAWGVFTLRTLPPHGHQWEGPSKAVLILLVPCPVCFSAVLFSTWTALELTRLPPLAVGVAMGFLFVALCAAIHLAARLLRSNASCGWSPRVALALTMMAIGAYFLAAMILPAKIQQARGVYDAFVAETDRIGSGHWLGVWALLAIAGVLGFFARRKTEPCP